MQLMWYMFLVGTLAGVRRVITFEFEGPEVEDVDV
jgi:hypothetical protein